MAGNGIKQPRTYYMKKKEHLVIPNLSYGYPKLRSKNPKGIDSLDWHKKIQSLEIHAMDYFLRINPRLSLKTYRKHGQAAGGL